MERIRWLSALLQLMIVFCASAQNVDEPIHYVSGYDAGMKAAASENKKVVLFTGTPNFLKGTPHRKYFEDNFLKGNEVLERAVKRDWLVCEAFTARPVSTRTPSGGILIDREMSAEFSRLDDKYELVMFGPRVTLVETDGRKIAGPFDELQKNSLAWHIEPPKLADIDKLAKGRKFAVFSGTPADVDKPAIDSKLIATAPFRTMRTFAYITGEHDFQVRDVGVDPMPEPDGTFGSAQIFVAGRVAPAIATDVRPWILLNGAFYRAQTGSIAKDGSAKGIGTLMANPGEDYLIITVDNEESLRAFRTHLESMKVGPTAK